MEQRRSTLGADGNTLARDAGCGITSKRRTHGDVVRDRGCGRRRGAKRHGLPGDRRIRRTRGDRLRDVPRARRPPARGTGSYYTPPGFFAVGGVGIELGNRLGLEHPERIGQLANAVAAVGTVLLLLVLVRLLWPGREVLHLATIVFFVVCPVVMKSAAMFHPEPLSMLLSTAALVLAAHLLARSDYRLRIALALGRDARPRAARPRLDPLDGGRGAGRSGGRGAHATARSASARHRARGRRGRRDARSRTVVCPPARPLRQRRLRPAASRRAGLVAPTARVLRRCGPPRDRDEAVSPVVRGPVRAHRLHRGLGRLLRRVALASRRRSAVRRHPPRARDDVDRRPAVHAASRSPGGSRFSASPSDIRGASRSVNSLRSCRSPPSPASSISRPPTPRPTGTP